MFYLTLPSNSSMNHYTDNNASHHYTKLRQTVDLSGDFEVGLSEIQFSNSYCNVEKGECSSYRTTEQHHIDVPEGSYDTGDNFIYVINNLIKSAVRKRSSEQGRIKFYYNRANKRASITIYERGGVVRFYDSCLRWKRKPCGGCHGAFASHCACE